MAQLTPADGRVRVSDLSTKAGNDFSLSPGPEARAALAETLGLEAVRKLNFAGNIHAEGRADWRLEARLGATVVQPCVVTLQPVTTRIDRVVERRFLADPPEMPAADEIEMPDDVTEEHLGHAIDLEAIMAEALALSVPDYPRAEGVELGEVSATPPGAAPKEDAEVKPFAGLADLKRKLEKGE